MFVKKLVEKASFKKPVVHTDGLKSSDVDPRVVFHHGIPSGSSMFAYDPIQQILAVSTKDGRIKLFGRDNKQTLLESDETGPSKFLEFIQNHGILLNVTSNNHIEVWDINNKLLCKTHAFKEEITSFAVMQQSLYIYVGDSSGNISVLKFEQDPCDIVLMKYNIPVSETHGNPTEVCGDTAVLRILPQPTAESKRVLVIFRSGLIILWEVQESKSIFTTGGNGLQSLQLETRKVTSACWVCPSGSKVAVGYSNGEILVWSIPSLSSKSEVHKSIQSTPICKLNVGYKSEKIPIASLRWVYADGRASRLYVVGASNMASTNLSQVILLNEHVESRTIKLGIHVSEPCSEIEIVRHINEQSKNNQDFLLLLGQSGHIYAYDDCLIEKHLLQSHSRSLPSLPKEVMLKMPFAESSITTAKFITNETYMFGSSDEDYIQLAEHIPSIIPLETKPNDGNNLSSTPFRGFTMVKNLYITGHSDGSIKFWDVTCPLFVLVFSLKQQNENGLSSSATVLTALHFDRNSRVLFSGDQSGMVHIYKFKPEPYSTENSFLSLPGSTKRGNSHIIHSPKHIKVNGAVISLNTRHGSVHLAVGTDKGYVSVIDIEGPTLLYQKHIASEISPGIISLQFETCSLHSFEKNVLVVATKDSSVLALDGDNGNMLSTSMVCPKKPSRALFMQILDGQNILNSNISNGLDLNRSSVGDVIPKQLSLLICSEKAVYVYSLVHILQGIKKVQYKKKFNSSSCCWASTFYSASDVTLILVFTSGKLEIRSLPDLSLIKESSIRGFTYSSPKSNSLSDTTICSSWDGDLVMVNGDQEVFFVSVLLQKETLRLLDSFSQVYREDAMISQESFTSGPLIPKEKKKGVFGSVFKDKKGSKSKPMPDLEIEDTQENNEELSRIFVTANFHRNVENLENVPKDEDDIDIDIDIDDIDLGDCEEKPKEHNMMASINKQALTSKLRFFKGKFNKMMVKNEKSIGKDEPQEGKDSSIHQIKKKYGFSSASETSVAKTAENKLHENVKKLQGINLKTTEMQQTAKSFSFMAKDLLRTAENGRRSS